MSMIGKTLGHYQITGHVPAFADFLASRGSDAGHIPEMDKKSYIAAYPIEARCIAGSLGRAQTGQRTFSSLDAKPSLPS